MLVGPDPVLRCFTPGHTSVSHRAQLSIAAWLFGCETDQRGVGVYLPTAGSASTAQPEVQPKTLVNFTSILSDLKQMQLLLKKNK